MGGEALFRTAETGAERGKLGLLRGRLTKHRNGEAFSILFRFEVTGFAVEMEEKTRTGCVYLHTMRILNAFADFSLYCPQ